MPTDTTQFLGYPIVTDVLDVLTWPFSKALTVPGIVTDSGLFRYPLLLAAMKPALIPQMNGSMTIPGTDPEKDVTYKQVSDFMVPASAGKPFEDKPGTFDATMAPRKIDKVFPLVMNRLMMEGEVNGKGITWEKYNEFRKYTTPGYVSKAPQPGSKVPDGKILALDPADGESTLLTEAKKLAEAAGSDKVILAFDGVTCPFFRLYAAESLAAAAAGTPTLHVYIREAEPCDVFDAGGMHCTTPLQMKRYVPEHKSIEERRLVATETKAFLETFYGKGKVNMWVDPMDDKLEAMYEARPWRQYVIEAKTGKLIAATGLAPFNNTGKANTIKAAVAA